MADEKRTPEGMARLYFIRCTIYELPVADQEKIKLAAVQIRAIVDDMGEHGLMALALVGAEKTVEQ